MREMKFLIWRDGKELELTPKEARAIRNQVERANHMEDAKWQFEGYINGGCSSTLDRLYDYLAYRFEQSCDCNMTENDIWENVCEAFVLDGLKNLDLTEEDAE